MSEMQQHQQSEQPAPERAIGVTSLAGDSGWNYQVESPNFSASSGDTTPAAGWEARDTQTAPITARPAELTERVGPTPQEIMQFPVLEQSAVDAIARRQAAGEPSVSLKIGRTLPIGNGPVWTTRHLLQDPSTGIVYVRFVRPDPADPARRVQTVMPYSDALHLAQQYMQRIAEGRN